MGILVRVLLKINVMIVGPVCSEHGIKPSKRENVKKFFSFDLKTTHLNLKAVGRPVTFGPFATSHKTGNLSQFFGNVFLWQS